MTGEVLNQHVTDPESCIQCSACEMACPNRAIENIAGRYCVDFDLCKNCGACIKDCPTGAADRFVQINTPHSQLEQAQWNQLPKDRQKHLK